MATTGRRSRLVQPFEVYAFDPGGTTGWSAVTMLSEKMDTDLTMDDFSFKCGEFGPGEHHDELYSFLEGEIATGNNRIQSHLAIESFNFRQFATDEKYGNAKVELISCEYIGIVKLFAKQWGIPIASWNSSEGKTFVPNLKLDKLGWMQYPKTPKRHMNDASRQLVSYLIKRLRILHPITTTWRD